MFELYQTVACPVEPAKHRQAETRTEMFSFEFKTRFYAGVDDWINGGGSAIVNPNGEFVAGPLWEKEEILTL